MTGRARLGRIIRWLWHTFWAGMAAYGRTAAGMPQVLDDPPPGHPERWCPDQPLTEVERGLARQLTSDVWGRWPR